MVLSIIEKFMLDHVDGKDLFLANQTVDDITQSVQNMLQQSELKLHNYIAYHGSFAEFIDTMSTILRRQEYHYLNPSIQFQGREKELNYLDGFLTALDNLLFAVITGQGGAGKSKLMFYYMQQRMSDLEWKIVFPSRVLIKKFKDYSEWRYPKNLLVIIDYAGELSKDIGEWLNSLIHTSQQHKIRIVLLERQGTIKDQNGMILEPLWYQQLADAGGQEVKEYLYQNRFYLLEPMGKSDLFGLIENIAKNEGKSIVPKDKENIYYKSIEFGTEEDPMHYNTLLFIILITDALLNEKDINRLRANTLMEYIVNKQRQYWKNSICSGNEDLFNSLEQMIVYATATGGWDLTPLNSPLDVASSKILNQYGTTDLKLLISNIAGNQSELKILPPVEPNPVGEYFVLWYMGEAHLKPFYKSLVKLLWKKPYEFANFLNRCISSYLCDQEEFIDGPYSLIQSDENPQFSSLLLVSLSARQSLLYAQKAAQMLAEYAQNPRYAEKQKIVLMYAQGLFNLSIMQGAEDAAQTVEKLRSLALDPRYAENSEIVLEYANGLVNLSNKQKAQKTTQTRWHRISEMRMIKEISFFLKKAFKI